MRTRVMFGSNEWLHAPPGSDLTFIGTTGFLIAASGVTDGGLLAVVATARVLFAMM